MGFNGPEPEPPRSVRVTGRLTGSEGKSAPFREEAGGRRMALKERKRKGGESEKNPRPVVRLASAKRMVPNKLSHGVQVACGAVCKKPRGTTSTGFVYGGESGI